MDVNVLRDLSNADGVVACEQEVRDVLKRTLATVVDETTYDGLGSMICKQVGTGTGPKVMIAAHMDEVGFMVRSITDGGLLMLMVVGGVKTSVLQFQKLRLTTREGKKLNGIVAGEYDPTASSKLYFDIGAKTKQEVLDLGVNIGDMVTFSTEFEALDLPNTYIGKAMDDRLGCYALYEIAKQMQHIAHPNDIYYVCTYGEEVGLRGAQTASYLVDPDLVFVIDVACYPDEFRRDNTNNRQIGAGPMLTHFDRTLSPNRALMNLVKDTAQASGLPLQMDMFNRGGTDGGEAHKVREGKATVVTCLPCRYGHCAYSLIDLTDTQNIAALYTRILPQLDATMKDTVYTF
ncbi:aminopeptidase [Lacticaseibacillus daqingensis]|uniref:aminopeptidase n=1 Tax=Lacticaseibacillus daqingensis TaxID=2486014 RepID=UPI000F779780|nr:aminopeptidase [Lacticaseibacillus daqingensis]